MNRNAPDERPTPFQMVHMSVLWLLYLAVACWGALLLLRRLTQWVLSP